MNSERQLKCLAAVWAFRGILTPGGFKDFKLDDGLPGWNKRFPPSPVSKRPWSAFDAGISTAVSQLNDMVQIVVNFQALDKFIASAAINIYHH